MSESIREQIIQAVLTRLGQITMINGYATDIGYRAVRATKYAPGGSTAQVVVIPRVEEAERVKYGKVSFIFPVDVHGFVSMIPGVGNASEKSEAVYADIIRAMTRRDTPLTGLADGVNITGGGGVELADNEVTLAGATASFEIKYKTVVGDPTTQ